METTYIDAKKVRFADGGITLKDSSGSVPVAVGKPIYMYHPVSRKIDVFLVMHIADDGITTLMRDMVTAITIPRLDGEEVDVLNEYYNNSTSWVPVAISIKEFREYRQEQDKVAVSTPTITIPKATFDGLKVVVQKNDTSKVSVADSMLLYVIDTTQEEVKPLPAIVASIDQDGFSLRVLGTNKLISVEDGHNYSNSPIADYQVVTMHPDHYTRYNSAAVEVERELRDLGELLVQDLGSTGDSSKLRAFKKTMERLQDANYL